MIYMANKLAKAVAKLVAQLGAGWFSALVLAVVFAVLWIIGEVTDTDGILFIIFLPAAILSIIFDQEFIHFYVEELKK